MKNNEILTVGISRRSTYNSTYLGFRSFTAEP